MESPPSWADGLTILQNVQRTSPHISDAVQISRARHGICYVSMVWTLMSHHKSVALKIRRLASFAVAAKASSVRIGDGPRGPIASMAGLSQSKAGCPSTAISQRRSGVSCGADDPLRFLQHRFLIGGNNVCIWAINWCNVKIYKNIGPI